MRSATAFMVLGVALVAGCSDGGSDSKASGGGVPSASVAQGAGGGSSGGASAPDAGASSPRTAGTPATTTAEAPKSGGSKDSSAFCRDVAPSLADNQTQSGPPTAKDVATWDHLDSEAPPGVKADVDKVDQGMHEIAAGTGMSDITGFGMAMQDILQWFGGNCVNAAS